MDTKKMRVVDLRAELQRRGLDPRGLKAELAQRLDEALEAEGGGTKIPLQTRDEEDAETPHEEELETEEIRSPRLRGKDRIKAQTDDGSEEDEGEEESEGKRPRLRRAKEPVKTAVSAKDLPKISSPTKDLTKTSDLAANADIPVSGKSTIPQRSKKDAASEGEDSTEELPGSKRSRLRAKEKALTPVRGKVAPDIQSGESPGEEPDAKRPRLRGKEKDATPVRGRGTESGGTQDGSEEEEAEMKVAVTVSKAKQAKAEPPGRGKVTHCREETESSDGEEKVGMRQTRRTRLRGKETVDALVPGKATCGKGDAPEGSEEETGAGLKSTAARSKLKTAPAMQIQDEKTKVESSEEEEEQKMRKTGLRGKPAVTSTRGRSGKSEDTMSEASEEQEMQSPRLRGRSVRGRREETAPLRQVEEEIKSPRQRSTAETPARGKSQKGDSNGEEMEDEIKSPKARVKAGKGKAERLSPEKEEKDSQEMETEVELVEEIKSPRLRGKAGKEKAEALARDKAEAQATEKAEKAEAVALEKAEKEKAERLAREKAEVLAHKRLEKEKAEKEKAESLAREKTEKDKVAALAKEKAEKAEALAKEKAEKAEALAKEKAEKAEALAKQKAEKAEALAKQKAEKAEALAREEKAAKEKAEALAREKKEKAEALARERKEKAEALAREKAEKAEALAREKAEKEKAEALAREKAEKEKAEALAREEEKAEAQEKAEEYKRKTLSCEKADALLYQGKIQPGPAIPLHKEKAEALVPEKNSETLVTEEKRPEALVPEKIVQVLASEAGEALPKEKDNVHYNDQAKSVAPEEQRVPEFPSALLQPGDVLNPDRLMCISEKERMPEGIEPKEPGHDGVNGRRKRTWEEMEPEAGPSEDGQSGDDTQDDYEKEGTEEDLGLDDEPRSERSETTSSDDQRRGVKRPREEHGRTYHEYKEEAYYSRSRSPAPEEEDEDAMDESQVCLDTYNSDLQFKVSKDRYGGKPLFSDRFPALWCGARCTYGVSKGRVCFEAKVVKNLALQEGSSEVPLLRVGWSVDCSSSQLGEDEFSYGFDGRGLKATGGEFEAYGEAFGENEVIGCFANFKDEVVELSFSRNGCALGVAFQIDQRRLAGRPLLPHVLCKNCALELNFGQKEAPYFPVPEGFTFLHSMAVEDRVRTPAPPKTAEECEVLLMVGLPGAGKTHWVRKHVREHPEKRYSILGTDGLLNQMRMRGPEVPEMDPQRLDTLIKQATQCLIRLVPVASRRKGNFILDQCTVYNSAQRRKLHAFKGFSRKAVVVVPSDEDLKKRQELRRQEEGDELPEHVLLEMKANYSLPERCDYVDEVLYVELQKEEAEKLVAATREEALKVLPPQEKRANRRNNRNRPHRGFGQGNNGGGTGRGYDNRPYVQQQQNWGQAGNRGWQNFYQDRDRYYRNYYGYQGYR